MYNKLGLAGVAGPAERRRIHALRRRLAAETVETQAAGKPIRHPSLSDEVVARVHAALP